MIFKAFYNSLRMSPRRRSAGVRVRGILEKVIGGNSTAKSCENLNVLLLLVQLVNGECGSGGE